MLGPMQRDPEEQLLQPLTSALHFSPGASLWSNAARQEGKGAWMKQSVDVSHLHMGEGQNGSGGESSAPVCWFRGEEMF